VFTARYALSPYIKQIRFGFKGLNVSRAGLVHRLRRSHAASCYESPVLKTGRNLFNILYFRFIKVKFVFQVPSVAGAEDGLMVLCGGIHLVSGVTTHTARQVNLINSVVWSVADLAALSVQNPC
jgi:hypothetical protein